MRPGWRTDGPLIGGSSLYLASCLLLSSCSPAPSIEPPRNVIVLMVDTLRADHMSLYGYDRETTPFLDRWARDAVVFERGFSQAGCTFPSINSLLTSRYPQRFVARKPRRLGFVETDWTLAEILQRNGYDTLAVSASSIVRDSPSRYNRHGGFGAGFDRFDESCQRQTADCVNRVALDWLAEPDRETDARPFLLYLHYMEPHSPYQPPASFERRFATGSVANSFVRRGLLKPIKKSLYEASGRPIDPGEVEFLEDLYDEEIRFIDQHLEQLMVALEARGLHDDTIVVLASDHGEEFLEHGHLAHCRDLAFDTVVRTPLVLRVPRLESRRRVTEVVANLDVLPTLLDYLEIDATAYELEGVSLRPLLERESSAERHAFSSQGTTRVVTDGHHQLLLDLVSGEALLLDLTVPPALQRDVGDRHTEARQRLLAALLRWIERVEGSEISSSIEAARELESRLQAVGYL